jgi:hypothetical protein
MEPLHEALRLSKRRPVDTISAEDVEHLVLSSTH